MLSKNVYLLVAHVFMVGVFAPALAYSIFFCFVGDYPAVTVLGAFFGAFRYGVVFSCMIWFFSYPFAFLTIGICILFCKMDLTQLCIWVTCGALLGGAYTLVVCCWTGFFAQLLLLTGGSVGMIASVILRHFWMNYYPVRA